ncbi:MAG TPA: CheR family methyltransferase [Candidatus Udaeobacter sp.]|nr:CheR family methyltransferase [Candidatus Udaeobacter sp.]
MDSQDSAVQVVGIGASAGAMDPLREFFSELPADGGLAFVVVQHLDPTHVSYMASLLAKHTTMKVAEAQDQTNVQANCVYTIPPNKFLFIRDGMLHLTEPVKRDGLRMPIDFFFRSLAEDQHDKAVAVLLSGSGSDGTLAIREVRGAGGVVFVQDPKTAQFDAMIENAIATGLVDYVLPVRQIPGPLLQYVQQSRIEPTGSSETRTLEDGIKSILNLLVSETKSDFRCYKKSTIQRRIERRMGLAQIREIADYARFLSQNPDELGKLSKDMLIGVTSFFRDIEPFEELRDRVIESLVKEQNNENPLRVWVPGCATGEEAYSIVMLLMEEMNRAGKNLSLQVFASDIDREALKYARDAIYSQSITADLSEERLARFFTKKDGTYQIAKHVREVVTFAEHNVITDPPFLKMDLISCRNLLIYIEPEIQKRVLNLFAFALKPLGYLFLGKSDTTVDRSDLYEPISRNLRIFRRRHSVSRPVGNLPLRFAPPIRSDRLEGQPPIKLSDLNQQVLLAHFNAAIVLVNEDGKIMHFYGPTNKYLTHPSGDANLSLFDMIENRYSLMLRLALERAAQENNSVKLSALDLNRGNSAESVDVTITPAVEPRSGKRMLAVIFEPGRTPLKNPFVSAQETAEPDVDITAHLEAENKRLKAELQAAIESFETSHEEFTAANEEVLAINEELQSANEELETSKEELQSVNEELTTVNAQLNEKVEELNKINDDLANFLNSSEVGTLFLDREFCIRRFTPSATALLNLIPLDIGRPVGDISTKVVDADLVSIAGNVLKSLALFEKEVQTSDGVWYMLRCLPYRTLSDVIDGVVFTFTDVSRLKHSEEAIMEARDYAENIIDTMRESLIVLDPELKVVSANRAFYETFQTSPGTTRHQFIYELGNRQWNIPKLREWLEKITRRPTVREF